jgi:hypothetical protein
LGSFFEKGESFLETENKDLLAQVTAQKLMINAILIALVDKNVFSKEDVEILIEASISGLDSHKDTDQIHDLAASYVEDFRSAIE